MTKEELAMMSHKIQSSKVGEYAIYLTDTMDQYDISRSEVIEAAFLATILHESADLSRFEENLNYSAKGLRTTWPSRFKDHESALPFARKPEMIANEVYGGRLGNIDPGDGWKYRGRGAIMITGRDNYREASNGIGVDLVAQPALLAEPILAIRASGWWWRERGLNELAEEPGEAPLAAFKVCTKIVNGGLVGWDDRQLRWHRVRTVLGA